MMRYLGAFAMAAPLLVAVAAEPASRPVLRARRRLGEVRAAVWGYSSMRSPRSTWFFPWLVLRLCSDPRFRPVGLIEPISGEHGIAARRVERASR
jgi:hypothetical protein